MFQYLRLAFVNSSDVSRARGAHRHAPLSQVGMNPAILARRRRPESWTHSSATSARPLTCLLAASRATSFKLDQLREPSGPKSRSQQNKSRILHKRKCFQKVLNGDAMLTKRSLVRSLMFEAFKYHENPNFSVEMQMFC